MCTSCKKFINDQLLTLNKEVCHENWKCIYRKNCHLTLTNKLDLHNFLIIIESGSLSYWIQHTKLYIWGKSHALIIFWKLPWILAAKQLDYQRNVRYFANNVFKYNFVDGNLIDTSLKYVHKGRTDNIQEIFNIIPFIRYLLSHGI